MKIVIKKNLTQITKYEKEEDTIHSRLTESD